MSAAATLILAFGMSMDAFAAALGKGAALHRPRFIEAIRTGLIFGVIETLTPLIGWAAGMTAAAWIADIDHWAAFAILGVLGARMSFHAIRRQTQDEAPRSRHSLTILVLTAIGTSLDAMAVGVTLALMGVDILTAALAIGAATFLMTTLGTLAGRWMGPLFGRGAELMGGLCLVAIGTKILLDHTLFLG